MNSEGLSRFLKGQMFTAGVLWAVFCLDVASGFPQFSNHSGHSGNLKSCGRNGVLHGVGTPRSVGIMGPMWGLSWAGREIDVSKFGITSKRLAKGPQFIAYRAEGDNRESRVR